MQATKKPHNYHKTVVWQKDDRIRKSPLKFYVYYYSELSGDCQVSIFTELWRLSVAFCVTLWHMSIFSRHFPPYLISLRRSKRNLNAFISSYTAESEKNRLAGRERYLQEIQSFTLLSDVFASVVLKDIPACQHVLRILTGRQKLCLCQVKTQYSISRAVSRGARLDVFAEDLEGNLYAVEIQRMTAKAICPGVSDI